MECPCRWVDQLVPTSLIHKSPGSMVKLLHDLMLFFVCCVNCCVFGVCSGYTEALFELICGCECTMSIMRSIAIDYPAAWHVCLARSYSRYIVSDGGPDPSIVRKGV